MRPSAGIKVLMATAVSLSALYLLSLVVVDRPESGYLPFWDGWLYFGAGLLPVALLVARALHDRRHRWSWWFLAGGVACTWIADLVYEYHDANLSDWRFPATSDVFYFAAYPLWAAGILTMAFAGATGVQRAKVLDGFILGLTVGSLAVIGWFGPIFEQSGSASDVALAISLAVFDVMLVVVSFASLAPRGYRPGVGGWTLVAGASIFGLGDIIYLNLLTHSDYVGGTLMEAPWCIGLLLFGVSAWLPWRRQSEADEPSTLSVRGSLGPVPAVAAIASLAIVGVGLVWGVPHAIPGLAAAMAMAAIALALVRVLWTMRELRKINDGFQQARTDDLTGLRNRRGFMEQVDELLEASPGPVSVLMIDLNGFKEVNDSLGHPAGDRLLVIVGQRLSAAVPAGLALARLGGDEFGLALLGSIDEGAALAQRLLHRLEGPVELDGLSVRVSASVGIAAASGSTRQELIRMADVAMYDAKRHGTGLAQYSESSDPHGRERIQLFDDLCRAIEARSFHLHLQPVIDVATDRIVAMEALIRWDHPERGALEPVEFIPMAERAGLIPRVTRVVLDLAAGHIASLHRLGLDVSTSVNISALDLVDEDLPTYVVEAFEQAGAPLRGLTLEITETAVTSDPARSLRTLQALRARGVRISIDDFGVGYSSLTQLLQLPVDELKLDQSFIAPIEHDRRAQAIVRSTVELGRTLGLTVVAEGVESEGALTFVREHGVERAQGFHLGRPMAFDDFVAFATASRERLQGPLGPGR